MILKKVALPVFLLAISLIVLYFLSNSNLAFAREKTTKSTKKEVTAEKKGKIEEKKKETESAPQQALPPDPKELAKNAYKEGKEYYDKGDYQKALEAFMAAYNYMPNPFVFISIAQCYDKLGKCTEAKEYYTKYMNEKPDAGNIPEIKEKIAEIESRKGKVKINSEPSGATVTIDGETIEMKTPASVEIKGGDHALALSMDGYIMETRAFTVPICGEVELNVQLKSAAPEEIKPAEDISKVVAEVKEGKKEKKGKIHIRFGTPHYIAFGIAGGAAIVAAVTGGLALKKSNDFADKKDEYKADPTNEDLYNQLEDIKNQGKPLSIISDVFLGVAGVSAVTGIALMFIGGQESRELSFNPLITKGGAGASLKINF